MNDLVEKFEKMHLKLAERIESLATQVEKKSKPSYRQNYSSQTTYAPENDTRTCYKCGQQGHLARNCLSERPATYQNQYAPQQQQYRPQQQQYQNQQQQSYNKNKRVNYITTEEDSEQEYSSDEEEPVYV